MTHDIDIGFKEKPESLEEFLIKEGYSEIDRTSKECTVYARGENDWPQIFYYPATIKVKEGEKPNWQESGHNIISEVNINYVLDVWDEAERMSDAIMKKFNAVLYDSNSDEYFEGGK